MERFILIHGCQAVNRIDHHKAVNLIDHHGAANVIHDRLAAVEKTACIYFRLGRRKIAGRSQYALDWR